MADEERTVSKCSFCNKPTPEGNNYCDWRCSVGHAERSGGKKHQPNGLPIACIKHDNSMWEHEHGDHHDYKFPVEVEFTGVRPILPDWDGSYTIENHALIYTDGWIVLTLYECSYAMWELGAGMFTGGDIWKKGEWRLTDESLVKIREMLK